MKRRTLQYASAPVGSREYRPPQRFVYWLAAAPTTLSVPLVFLSPLGRGDTFLYLWLLWFLVALITAFGIVVYLLVHFANSHSRQASNVDKLNIAATLIAIVLFNFVWAFLSQLAFDKLVRF